MSVKVLDFRTPTFEADFTSEMRRIGAAVVVNHPISLDLIERAYANWHPAQGGFFGRDDDQKRSKFWQDVSRQCNDPEVGFFPMHSEKGSEHHGRNKGTRNENEYYHVKQGIPGSYPPGDFRATRQLAEANKQLVFQLLDILDRHGPSKAEAPFFGNLVKRLSPHKWSTFRWLHYPPYNAPGNPDEEVELIKVHKDKGCLTTVISPSERGLSVEDREGKTYEVPCIKGSVVVQIGEGLEMMSGGYYFAGRHTVRGPRKMLSRTRVSAARFWHFKPSVRLAEGVTNGDMMKNYWDKKGLKA